MNDPTDRGQDELSLVVVGGGVAGLFAALCAASEGEIVAATESAEFGDESGMLGAALLALDSL